MKKDLTLLKSKMRQRTAIPSPNDTLEIDTTEVGMFDIDKLENKDEGDFVLEERILNELEARYAKKINDLGIYFHSILSEI